MYGWYHVISVKMSLFEMDENTMPTHGMPEETIQGQFHSLFQKLADLPYSWFRDSLLIQKQIIHQFCHHGQAFFKLQSPRFHWTRGIMCSETYQWRLPECCWSIPGRYGQNRSIHNYNKTRQQKQLLEIAYRSKLTLLVQYKANCVLRQSSKCHYSDATWVS